MEAKTSVSQAAVFDNISITDSLEGVYTLIAECTDCPNGPLVATSTPVRVLSTSEMWVLTDCGVLAPPQKQYGLEGDVDHSCVLSISLVEGGKPASLIAPVTVEVDVLDKNQRPALRPRIRVVPDEHVFVPGGDMTKSIHVEALEQHPANAAGMISHSPTGSASDQYTMLVRTRSTDHRWSEPAVRWPNGKVAHVVTAPTRESTVILPVKEQRPLVWVAERDQRHRSRSDLSSARPGEQRDTANGELGPPRHSASLKQTPQDAVPEEMLPSFLMPVQDHIAQIKWNSTEILVREGTSIHLSFHLGSRPLDSVYVSISCPSPFIKHVKDRAEVQPEDWLFGDSLILTSLPRPGYPEAQYSVSCHVSSRSEDRRYVFDSDSFSSASIDEASIFGATVQLSIYRHQCHDGSFKGFCPCPAGYVCDGATVVYKCPAGTEREFTVFVRNAEETSPVATASMGKDTAHIAGEATCNRLFRSRAGSTIVRQGLPSGWYESGYQSSTSSEVQKYRLQMQGYCGMGTYGRLYVDVTGRPGEYYATYNSTCATCPPGTFCYDVGIVKFQAYKCPAGHYCLGGDSIPVPCPPGKYNPFRGAMSSNACMTCPDGFDCESLQQKIEPELCPPGFICPFGRKKVACPAGTVNPLPASAQPDPCAGVSGWCGPEAHRLFLFCPFEIVDDEVPVVLKPPGQSALEQCERCPAGYYCPNKAGAPKPCPAGTYNPFEGASSSSECVPCPVGFQCDTEGAVYYLKRCSAGTYCNTAGAAPALCPEGTWKPGYLGNSLMHCHVCPAGAQCKQGTTAATIEKCPRGSFCSSGTYMKVEAGDEGVVKQEICAPCEPGNSCKDGFKVACGKGYYSGPGQAECNECPEGFYCPLEKTTKYLLQTYRCPDSQYCPNKGTVSRLLAMHVVSATYRSIKGAREVSDCWPCKAGEVCSQGSATPTLCAPGEYCPSGGYISLPCPKGTVSTQQGLQKSKDCDECPAGKYCSKMGATSPTGECKPGFFCESGASTLAPEGSLCPTNAFCPEGAETPGSCDDGFFIPWRGAHTKSSCVQCPAGMYCERVASGPTVVKQCHPGYYCEAGATTPTANPAPPGSYAPAGSVQPLKCLPGTFTDVEAQAECKLCAEGKLCSGLGSTREEVCPKGSYCPAATTKAVHCPQGTYGVRAGLSDTWSCTPCGSGKYCPDTGLQDDGANCAAGFHCSGGSRSIAPLTSEQGGSICRKGYFCTAGTKQPTECPRGTYNPNEGASTEADCLDCPAGSKYGLALSSNYSLCESRYKAYGNAIAGTFQDADASATCLVCPAGYACAPGSSQGPVPQHLCAAGHYCPAGTTSKTMYPCPPGFYNPNTGARSLEDCRPCPPGRYCDRFGLDAPTGDCAEGYYCSGGATSAKGQYEAQGANDGAGRYDIGCLETDKEAVAQENGVAIEGVDSGADCMARCQEDSVCKYFSWNPSKTCTLITQTFELSSCAGCVAGPKSCSSDCFFSGFDFTGTVITTYRQTRSAHLCQSRCVTNDLCSVFIYDADNTICYLKAHDALSHRVKAPNVNYIAGPNKYCGFGGTLTSICRFPAGIPGTASQICTGAEQGYADLLEAGRTCEVTRGCRGIQYLETKRLYYLRCGSVNEKLVEGGATWFPIVCGDMGLCPKGTYCPAGSARPRLCGIGKYCSDEGAGSEKGQCRAGFWCPGGYSCPSKSTTPTAVICTKGHYCPAGAAEPIPCPQGEHQPGVGQSECVACPAGKACGAATDPDDCPAGYFCPAGTVFAHQFPCPAGSYSAETGNVSSDECQPCPEGRVCDEPGTPTARVLCPQGYYCPEGTDGPHSNPCEAGQYCPAGISDPQLCSTGYFCGAERLSQPSGGCYGGFLCLSGASSPSPFDATVNGACTETIEGGECPAGNFCAPASTLDDVLQSQGQTPSSVKAPGHAIANPNQNNDIYVVDDQVVKKIDGRTEEATVRSYDLTECTIKEYRGLPTRPVGIAVDNTSTFLYIVASGAHKVVRLNLATEAVSHWLGSGQAGDNCGPGVELVDVQLNEPQDVAIDDEGYVYVADTGNKRIVMVDGLQAEPIQVVLDGVAPSPATLEKPVAVLVTQINSPFNKLKVVACNAQMTIWRIHLPSGIIAVSAGDGTTGDPVADGTLPAASLPLGIPKALGKGTQVDGQLFDVLIGDATPNGLRRLSLGASIRFLDVAPEPCPPVGDGLWRGLSICRNRVGMWTLPPKSLSLKPGCDRKLIYLARPWSEALAAVSIGTFMPYKGGRKVSECIPCPAGMYCQAVGQVVPSGRCEKAYFCPQGSTSPTEKQCPAKHYCDREEDVSNVAANTRISTTSRRDWVDPNRPEKAVDGAASAAQGWLSKNTPDGSHGVELELDAYYVISKYRIYSGDTTGANASQWLQASIPVENNDQREAEGSIMDVYTNKVQVAFNQNQVFVAEIELYGTPLPGALRATPCPPGTYQDEQGQTECKACPPGHQCPGGQTEMQGHICWEGSWLEAPFTGDVNPDLDAPPVVLNGLCPQGYYCPAGTPAPIPCPKATYAAFEGAKASGECTPCPPGYACPSKGEAVPCGSGYYCTTAAESAWPAEPQQGGICTAGHYCPEGSYQEKPCPPGAFSSQGQVECTRCTAGYYCDKSKTALVDKQCATGHFCPEGSSFQRPCPPGTFTSDKGASVCSICTPRYYCDNSALNSPSSLCEEGYVCGGGAVGSRPSNNVFVPGGEARFGACPPGHYCVPGTHEPTACSAGTYQGTTVWNQLQYRTRQTESREALVLLAGTAPRVRSPRKHVRMDNLLMPQDRENARPVRLVPHATQTARSLQAVLEASSDGNVPSDLDSDCSPCPNGKYCRAGIIAGDCAAGCMVCTVAGMAEFPAQQDIFVEVASQLLRHAQKDRPALPPAVGTQLTALSALLGYYCGAGQGALASSNVCPAGHYCPPGTGRPYPCPAGTYAPSRGSKDPSHCVPCSAGYFCSRGSAHPTGVCPAGTYCPQGTSVPQPCPAGFSCPEGAIKPASCPASSYCPGVTGKALECPLGTYCPVGAQFPEPCPAEALGSDTFQESDVAFRALLSNEKIFQESTRTCVCQKGYIYIENGIDLSDQDGKADCQEEVYDECDYGEVRDPESNCIVPDVLCDAQCGPQGGTYHPDYQRCLCAGLVTAEEVCDESCRRRAGALIIHNGNLVFTDSHGVETSVFPLDALLGDAQILAGNPYCSSNNGLGCTVVLQEVSEDGIRGLVGPPRDLEVIFKQRISDDASSQSPDLRSLLQRHPIITSPYTRFAASSRHPGLETSKFLSTQYTSGASGILNPIQCITAGTIVAWLVRPGEGNISAPRYPVYLKRVAINTVDDFDYGLFTKLQTDLLAGVKLLMFAYTFDKAGVYSFAYQDNALLQSVVKVVDGVDELCPPGFEHPQPQTRETLETLGIAAAGTLHLTPAWVPISVACVGIIAVISVVAIFLYFFRRYFWVFPIEAGTTTSPKRSLLQYVRDILLCRMRGEPEEKRSIVPEDFDPRVFQAAYVELVNIQNCIAEGVAAVSSEHQARHEMLKDREIAFRHGLGTFLRRIQDQTEELTSAQGASRYRLGVAASLFLLRKDGLIDLVRSERLASQEYASAVVAMSEDQLKHFVQKVNRDAEHHALEEALVQERDDFANDKHKLILEAEQALMQESYEQHKKRVQCTENAHKSVLEAHNALGAILYAEANEALSQATCAEFAGKVLDIITQLEHEEEAAFQLACREERKQIENAYQHFKQHWSLRTKVTFEARLCVSVNALEEKALLSLSLCTTADEVAEVEANFVAEKQKEEYRKAVTVAQSLIVQQQQHRAQEMEERSQRLKRTVEGRLTRAAAARKRLLNDIQQMNIQQDKDFATYRQASDTSEQELLEMRLRCLASASTVGATTPPWQPQAGQAAVLELCETSEPTSIQPKVTEGNEALLNLEASCRHQLQEIREDIRDFSILIRLAESTYLALDDEGIQAMGAYSDGSWSGIMKDVGTGNEPATDLGTEGVWRTANQSEMLSVLQDLNARPFRTAITEDLGHITLGVWEHATSVEGKGASLPYRTGVSTDKLKQELLEAKAKVTALREGSPDETEAENTARIASLEEANQAIEASLQEHLDRVLQRVCEEHKVECDRLKLEHADQMRAQLHCSEVDSRFTKISDILDCNARVNVRLKEIEVEQANSLQKKMEEIRREMASGVEKVRLQKSSGGEAARQDRQRANEWRENMASKQAQALGRRSQLRAGGGHTEALLTLLRQKMDELWTALEEEKARQQTEVAGKLQQKQVARLAKFGDIQGHRKVK
ncbi:hypothetical protein NCLIV_049760 [Neospora caninum Liverpool]|uniref:Apple domain-containing protein n=1 Tax=Neospora caninum (strain Liverpool) TaxID=572307 RepID=F0VKE6_NEOCL|nr:hypothetical protein NCLIV_049760 [Neospora caninum Liverpool]CBZ54547.1 hypothetical protein NCLIV_049760 [Neospora caninum Liverpool]CEL69261.1 TPA: hypothetical protein BN1204_049760 [Neospora caninum Liverpool]|eukprot:XP_003884577.1 hypothetical protein NCLIV_049760 [Neospora caninum Liverpool]